MTLRYPPRREPRVLMVVPNAKRLLWAVADPWEMRGAGRLCCTFRAQASAIMRLVRRERPTVVVAPRRGFKRLRFADLGVPLLPASFPIAPDPIARELFPEIAVHATTRALRKVAAQAISAVLHGHFPSRKYAITRHRTVLRRS
jgi:hypothetical protein